MTNKELFDLYLDQRHKDALLTDEDKKGLSESISFASFKVSYHSNVFTETLISEMVEATRKLKDAFDTFSQSIKNSR